MLPLVFLVRFDAEDFKLDIDETWRSIRHHTKLQEWVR